MYSTDEIRDLLRQARPRPHMTYGVKITDLLNGGTGGKRMVGSKLIPSHTLHNLLLRMVEGPPAPSRGNLRGKQLATSAKRDLEKVMVKLERLRPHLEPDNPHLDARSLVKDAIVMLSATAGGLGAVIDIRDIDEPPVDHVPTPKRKGTTGRRPRPRDVDGVMHHCHQKLSKYYHDRTSCELTGLLLHSLRLADNGRAQPLPHDVVRQRLRRV